MTILFIIIAVVFTLAMAVLTIRPFLMTRHRQLNFEMLDEELRQIESLVSRKVALVQALRDIEYDSKTNKISEEDYLRFKKSCERQAVGVMRRLESLHGGNRDWDILIDEAIEQRLANMDSDGTDAHRQSSQHLPKPERDVPTHCPGCQTPLEADDRFCSQCGQPISSGDKEATKAVDDMQSLSSPPRTSEVVG